MEKEKGRLFALAQTSDLALGSAPRASLGEALDLDGIDVAVLAYDFELISFHFHLPLSFFLYLLYHTFGSLSRVF